MASFFDNPKLWDFVGGFGQGLMANAGPSPYPVSLFDSLGAGFQGANQALQDDLMRELLEERVAATRAEREREAAAAQAQEAFLGSVTDRLSRGAVVNPATPLRPGGAPHGPLAPQTLPGGGGGLFDDPMVQASLFQAFPEKGIELLSREPKAGFTLTPGSVRYDAAGQPIASLPAEPKLSDIEKRALAAGYEPGTPEYQNFIRQATLKPSVSITSTSETEFKKGIGKSANERRDLVINSAAEAQNQLATLARLADLQQSVSTGPIQPALTGLQAIAQEFGIDLNSVADFVGVKLNEVGTAQEFQRLTAQLGLEAIQKMKPPISDRDLQFAVSTVTTLGRSPQGTALALATMKAVSERTALARDMLYQMEAEKGSSVETFQDFERAWAEYQRANPLEDEIKAKLPNVDVRATVGESRYTSVDEILAAEKSGELTDAQVVQELQRFLGVR